MEKGSNLMKKKNQRAVQDTVSPNFFFSKFLQSKKNYKFVWKQRMMASTNNISPAAEWLSHTGNAKAVNRCPLQDPLLQTLPNAQSEIFLTSTYCKTPQNLTASVVWSV